MFLYERKKGRKLTLTFEFEVCFFNFMYRSYFAYMYVCVLHLCLVSFNARRVIDDYELPCSFWELILGPLEEGSRHFTSTLSQTWCRVLCMSWGDVVSPILLMWAWNSIPAVHGVVVHNHSRGGGGEDVEEWISGVWGQPGLNSKSQEPELHNRFLSQNKTRTPSQSVPGHSVLDSSIYYMQPIPFFSRLTGGSYLLSEITCYFYCHAGDGIQGLVHKHSATQLHSQPYRLSLL